MECAFSGTGPPFGRRGPRAPRSPSIRLAFSRPWLHGSSHSARCPLARQCGYVSRVRLPCAPGDLYSVGRNIRHGSRARSSDGMVAGRILSDVLSGHRDRKRFSLVASVHPADSDIGLHVNEANSSGVRDIRMQIARTVGVLFKLDIDQRESPMRRDELNCLGEPRWRRAAVLIGALGAKCGGKHEERDCPAQNMLLSLSASFLFSPALAS